MEQVFKALAEPHRLKILKLLKDGSLPAGEIASHFSISRPAVSQHLRVLHTARLVRTRRVGAKRYYHLRQETYRDVAEFLNEFWDTRLARLKEAVENEEGK